MDKSTERIYFFVSRLGESKKKILSLEVFWNLHDGQIVSNALD